MNDVRYYMSDRTAVVGSRYLHFDKHNKLELLFSSEINIFAIDGGGLPSLIQVQMVDQALIANSFTFKFDQVIDWEDGIPRSALYVGDDPHLSNPSPILVYADHKWK